MTNKIWLLFFNRNDKKKPTFNVKVKTYFYIKHKIKVCIIISVRFAHLDTVSFLHSSSLNGSSSVELFFSSWRRQLVSSGKGLVLHQANFSGKAAVCFSMEAACCQNKNSKQKKLSDTLNNNTVNKTTAVL